MTVLTCALVCSAGAHAQTAAGMGPAALQGTVSSAQEAAIFEKFDGSSLQRVPGSYASGWTYGAK